jgi:HD domain
MSLDATVVVELTFPNFVEGICLPRSTLAKEVAAVVRACGSAVLYNHSSRVYCFGALLGRRKRLSFNPELLYVAAMFHDIGILPQHRSTDDRFEVDSANAAKKLLERHCLEPSDIEEVWTAVALHTTRGIPQYMRPTVALLAAAVDMDRSDFLAPYFLDADRDAIVKAFPVTVPRSIMEGHPENGSRIDCCQVVHSSARHRSAEVHVRPTVSAIDGRSAI